MDEKELEEMYGPAAPYSEHKRGEKITFIEAGETCSGVILWVCAAGAVGGRQTPISYLVESDQQDGFPLVVWPGDIIESD